MRFSILRRYLRSMPRRLRNKRNRVDISFDPEILETTILQKTKKISQRSAASVKNISVNTRKGNADAKSEV